MEFKKYWISKKHLENKELMPWYAAIREVEEDDFDLALRFDDVGNLLYLALDINGERYYAEHAVRLYAQTWSNDQAVKIRPHWAVFTRRINDQS